MTLESAPRSESDPWAEPADVVDADPNLQRRWRRLLAMTAVGMILAAGWLAHQAEGKPPPANAIADMGGVGPELDTLPGDFVPRSSEVQLELLARLTGTSAANPDDVPDPRTPAWYLKNLRGTGTGLFVDSEERRLHDDHTGLLASVIATGVGIVDREAIWAKVEPGQDSLGLDLTDARILEPAEPGWLHALGLPYESDLVEQGPFTIVMEPGIGVAVVDRAARPPRLVRRLPVPGVERMAGFAGGLALLARRLHGGPGLYDLLLLDLLDATGSMAAAPSLTEIERGVTMDSNLPFVAAQGLVGQGWRSVTTFVAAFDHGGNWHITADHRVWETRRAEGLSDPWLQHLGRRPFAGEPRSKSRFSLAPDGEATGARPHAIPSRIVAMTASRGLLYVLDAAQGLIVLDVATEPYWAQVAVPSDATPLDVDAPYRFQLEPGDGIDAAPDRRFVWLAGPATDLARLGRQVGTTPLSHAGAGSAAARVGGQLRLDDVGPSVRRIGKDRLLRWRVEAAGKIVPEP